MKHPRVFLGVVRCDANASLASVLPQNLEMEIDNKPVRSSSRARARPSDPHAYSPLDNYTRVDPRRPDHKSLYLARTLLGAGRSPS